MLKLKLEHFLNLPWGKEILVIVYSITLHSLGGYGSALDREDNSLVGRFPFTACSGDSYCILDYPSFNTTFTVTKTIRGRAQTAIKIEQGVQLFHNTKTEKINVGFTCTFFSN